MCGKVSEQLMKLLTQEGLDRNINTINFNEKFEKEHVKLISIYRRMDVDFESEMLSVMDEVIEYCTFYKVFKNYISQDRIQEIILENYDFMMRSFDSAYWRKINSEMFSDKNIGEIREAALKSQNSIFKDDYLVYFVEGNESFAFGNNTLRCPIHIFCVRAGIPEFLETLCKVDFIRSKYMKSGLVREKCLCYPGDNMCTFRWKNLV